MKLLWEIDTAVSPALTMLMQTAADCAAASEGIRPDCAVSIRLCDDEAIRALNAAYRQTDRATDVLSFPLVSYPEGVTAGQAEHLLRGAYDDDADACLLGDLVISVPHIYAQAEEYGHSPEREAAFPLVHRFCHLFGYYHV